MSYRNSGPLDCKVYVGNLGSQGSKNELERVFGYYGALKNVWVARNPPGFAFVEFEDNRDAEDAVRALDGRTVCGVRARVEMSSGQSRRGNDRDRGPPRGRRDDYYDRNRRESPRRHSRSRSRSPRRERRRYRSVSPYGNGRDSRSRSRS
uniref:RRM domain-containing protein n=1 Tax=Ciona intestinalis TaxID=7719 RepID=F6X986_CIOIN